MAVIQSPNLGQKPESGSASVVQASSSTFAVADSATKASVDAVTAKLSATPATSTLQTTLNNSIGLLTKPTDTQPISAVALPLPALAATSTKQDTAIASTNSVAAGVGAIADTPATSDTGSFSLIAFVKRLTAHIFAPRTNYGVLISTINDNIIVAAPTAGNEWVMTTCRIQSNAPSGTSSVVALIKKGASDPNPMRLRTTTDGTGMSEVYGFSEAIHFGDGNPIIVNLSATVPHGVTITYYRASVSTRLPS